MLRHYAVQHAWRAFGGHEPDIVRYEELRKLYAATPEGKVAARKAEEERINRNREMIFPRIPSRRGQNR